MTRSYLYRWTEKDTGMWYIGSRYANGCHPDDGYICSSKHVKPLILKNPSGWHREILVIGEPKYIRNLEANYLKVLDAAKDIMSYNKSNGNGSFHTAGLPVSEKHKKRLREDNPSFREDVKQKLRIAGLSRDVSHLHSEESQRKRSEGQKMAWANGKYAGVGFKVGEENIAKRSDIRDKISSALKNVKGTRMTGKKHSLETKLKMAESRRLYWQKKRENANTLTMVKE
jgi:hypothetical protein